MQNYDAIVIGAGQGGSPLAHKLADLGWHVALIEREYLGGSCINYGCTPTKAMLASARVAHYARRGSEFGVHAGDVRVDLAEVVERKNQLVLSWRQGQQNNADSRHTLDLYRTHGRFTGPHSVDVDGEELVSEHIFIDTGTRPRVPSIPGIDEVDFLTNRNVMDLTQTPEHLLVMGGNYIGLEFGQMFRRFGSRVTVIERSEQITSREDADVASSLQESLEAEGIEFRTNADATSVRRTGSGLDLTLQRNGREETISGSHLLVAIGQVPNSDELGLDRAGVEMDDGGNIKHNDRLETNVPGIWVIGDVKGGPAFTHVSYDDHLVIYDNLIAGKNRGIENRIVPYSLFTDPELGRVGLSEKAARDAGYSLKTASIPMEWVARAIERSETKGMMKLVVDAETDRILGAAMLGAEGGELVQHIATVMRADLPYTVLEKAMFIHPTLTEGFFTLIDSVKPE